MNLADIVVDHARKRPTHLAFIQGDVELTYGEFDALTARVAGWLTAHGVERGDRVLYYSENTIELLATYFGAARIGAIFAPVNAGFKLGEFSFIAQSAQPALAFVSESLYDDYATFEAELPELPRTLVVVGTGAVPSGRISFKEVASWERPAPIVDVDPDDAVLISFTSGSTATPKPVARSHGGETWSARTYADVWDYRPEDRALTALPLSWSYGMSTTTTAMLAAGATNVLLAHFNPVRVLDAIESERITLFAGTNTMFVKLLDVYRKQARDLSSVRNCYVGGEPINRSVTGAFEEVLGKRLWEGYAATEAFPILVTQPRTDADAPRETCGRIVPGAELRIVDEHGVEVSEGEVGEAQFTCPGRMLGYYKDPDLTSSRLTSDGWVKSGDLVRRDEDGYFFVVGRISEMIIRGGANIAPSEVESAIVTIEGIEDATVVAVPDEEYGESVVAFVSANDGSLDEDTVRTLLQSRLASFKVPARIFFNVDLPSGTTGKKDRRRAAAKAEELVAHV